VAQTEQKMSQLTLSNFQGNDLGSVNLLGAVWDTLGWIHFHRSDLPEAEKYVNAAWKLAQSADIADHLGQIYEKEGKHEAAIHMWRLAIAADRRYEAAKERLRQAGAPIVAPRVRGADPWALSPSEELGVMRTIKIPQLSNHTGSAEFFLLISRDGIEDAQLASEPPAFKEAVPAIRSAKYEFPFPDAGPEKIIRRGILSCSTYTTPSCQLTTLLPSAVKMADSIATQPALISKVEPKYSEAARKAKLEGTVLLGIVIGTDGVPRDVSVLKSLGMGLDESAKECVLQWRFKPATKDGKPVQSPAKVDIKFLMEKNPGS
jgi:TonB family protein